VCVAEVTGDFLDIKLLVCLHCMPENIMLVSNIRASDRDICSILPVCGYKLFN
jgi:hypothetical protein